MAAKSANPYKTHWYNRRFSFWFNKHAARSAGTNPKPPVIHLAAQGKSDKPPVRIFLGTEPAQHRAERVFVYALERVRNPARAYEVHLMSDVEGIDRSTWKTGFTNYRYCIPTWADGQGRAIYNDVDQIYLADPAEMFDLDLEGKGIAAISEQENSVMLIDCAKMIAHWNVDSVKNGLGHAAAKKAVSDNQLFRKLDGRWNARDGEFPVAETKCIHYTTLHTQPWEPFPDQLRYTESPVAYVWRDLEKEADGKGYSVFSKQRPSPQFQALLAQYEIMHHNPDPVATGKEAFDGRRMPKSSAKIAALVTATSTKTVLDYGSGKATFYQPFAGEPPTSRFKSNPEWPGVKVICYDPGFEPFAQPWPEKTDGVISTDVVEHIPEPDLPWILDEMFSSANRFVYVVAACYPAQKHLPNGQNAHCTIKSPEWWRDLMTMAARRHPGIRWVVGCDEKGVFGKKRTYFESAA